jgi:hypothetical protein
VRNTRTLAIIGGDIMVVAICNICNKVLKLSEVEEHFNLYHKKEKKNYRLENGLVFEYTTDQIIQGGGEKRRF